MKKFTLRLNKPIYNELKNNSDYLGVTLSSVLKFNLYTLKDKNFEIISFNNSDSIRMTLVIPCDFYDELKIKSDNLNASLNSFINSAFYFWLNS